MVKNGERETEKEIGKENTDASDNNKKETRHKIKM